MQRSAMADEPLAARRCRPHPPGSTPLEPAAIAGLIAQLPHWRVVDGEMVRTFVFRDYDETIAFVNATARISNAEHHHPDLVVSYGRVTVRYVTHDAGGLTENDFICAAKVDALSGR